MESKPILSVEQVQKILCTAIDHKILILTMNDKTAVEMRECITDYIHHQGIGAALSRYQSKRGCIYFNGGFENILLMPVDWWNNNFGQKCDFEGLVFVTNRQITDIKRIVNTPLPISVLW
jgi:hypothetical protein